MASSQLWWLFLLFFFLNKCFFIIYPAETAFQQKCVKEWQVIIHYHINSLRANTKTSISVFLLHKEAAYFKAALPRSVALGAGSLCSSDWALFLSAAGAERLMGKEMFAVYILHEKIMKKMFYDWMQMICCFHHRGPATPMPSCKVFPNKRGEDKSDVGCWHLTTAAD